MESQDGSPQKAVSSWQLSKKEAELIRLVRTVEFGAITAVIKSGMIEYVRREETIRI